MLRDEPRKSQLLIEWSRLGVRGKIQGNAMQQYAPGERIGGEFEVLEVFGGRDKSGMGVVYLVKNRELPLPIVLKTAQDLETEEKRRRFAAEAHAWIAAGAHANIVQA